MTTLFSGLDRFVSNSLIMDLAWDESVILELVARDIELMGVRLKYADTFNSPDLDIFENPDSELISLKLLVLKFFRGLSKDEFEEKFEDLRFYTWDQLYAKKDPFLNEEERMSLAKDFYQYCQNWASK